MDEIFGALQRSRDVGEAAVLVTVVAAQGHVPAPAPSKMLVTARGRVAGTVGGGAIEQRALARASAVLAAGSCALQEYVLDDGAHADVAEAVPMACGGRVTLFFEYVGPEERAYLFGAGHVGRALRDFLAPLDFAVTFVDCRPEVLADAPGTRLLAGADYAELPALAGLAASYVVIATHSHVCDERVLAALLATGERPRYLGVVASRRKREAMFAALRQERGDLDLAWIAMPVGLDLGGRSPAAIALSIAAEIQACRHGVVGHRHLRDRVVGP